MENPTKAKSLRKKIAKFRTEIPGLLNFCNSKNVNRKESKKSLVSKILKISMRINERYPVL